MILIEEAVKKEERVQTEENQINNLVKKNHSFQGLF